jgi:hypothetical protein
MAGPKLTSEKRAELRKEIGEQLTANAELAPLVKDLASKFGISETAVRWHHKKVVGGSAPPKAPRARRGRPKGSVTKRPVRKQRSSTRRGRPSSFKSLASALSKIAPADLRRAIKASKLQVKYDALVAKGNHLRQQLKATERSARNLERRLTRIIGG